MGFITEIRLTSKKANEVIKICPVETESDDSFTTDDLFKYIIGEICDINIDISKISSLELTNCHLTDLPQACKILNLKHLDLSHNNLEHVPICLYSGLEHLESLDLSYNLIKKFDLEPACILYIRKMKLNNNKFDNVPKWFLTFRCTNMEEFDYSHNNAKHYKFMKNSFNVNLLKLKKLVCISSCLIDQDFNFLKCFKQLQYLDVSNDQCASINRFDDLDNLFVKPKWKEINILKLNNLSISIFPEGIAWIETLKELHISGNYLSWVPDSVEYLVNLEILNVSNNDLVSLPKSLVLMEKLTVLQACKNYIDAVPDFSSMSNLKILDLFNNSLNYVSFSLDTIDCIDVEDNYCDTTEFKNFSLYEEKKNNLRKKYLFDGRCDGPKIKEPELLSSGNSSSTDEYYELLSNNKPLKSICNDENENWDLPSKFSKVHSDIDSEDDMWQGEENKSRINRTSETERIYISDDDWMFVDCNDS